MRVNLKRTQRSCLQCLSVRARANVKTLSLVLLSIMFRRGKGAPMSDRKPYLGSFLGAFVCLAVPVPAQIISPLPFGQKSNLVTPLPFGQRNVSPLRPLAKRAAPANDAAMVGSIVAQWNMDETSGTTMLDSSGNANDGTLFNVTETGDGYVFDGTTSKVVVPNSPTLNPGARDFSYSAQVQTNKIPPPGGDYDVIRKGAAATAGGGFRLEIEYSKGLAAAYCSMSDGQGHTSSVRGNTNVADGQLHTLTCQKTSTAITLMVDSLPPITKTVSLGTIDNAKALAIGCKSPTCRDGDSDWYVGTLHGASISLGS